MSNFATTGVTAGEPIQTGGHGSHSAGSASSSDFSAALQGSLQPYAAATTTRLPLARTSGRSNEVGEHQVPNAATDSRHIPLRAAQLHGADEHVHELALKLRAYRMELLASNIANADTPGYKARDIDVAQALREKIATVAEVPVSYVIPRQSSLDGNTVEMDVERGKFAENAVRYQFSLDRVIGHYRHMMELFQSLKD